MVLKERKNKKTYLQVFSVRKLFYICFFVNLHSAKLDWLEMRVNDTQVALQPTWVIESHAAGGYCKGKYCKEG